MLEEIKKDKIKRKVPQKLSYRWQAEYIRTSHDFQFSLSSVSSAFNSTDILPETPLLKPCSFLVFFHLLEILSLCLVWFYLLLLFLNWDCVLRSSLKHCSQPLILSFSNYFSVLLLPTFTSLILSLSPE